jgi:hypothetical protein
MNPRDEKPSRQFLDHRMIHGILRYLLWIAKMKMVT